MSDEIPKIRNQAELDAYAEQHSRIRAASSQTRADLAEGYLTRVQELEALNTGQAKEIMELKEEVVSLSDLLANCTESNLEFQRQLADLQQQLDNEVRLRQMDYDRGGEGAT